MRGGRTALLLVRGYALCCEVRAEGVVCKTDCGFKCFTSGNAWLDEQVQCVGLVRIHVQQPPSILQPPAVISNMAIVKRQGDLLTALQQVAPAVKHARYDGRTAA
jgi:hypothetical protein